jgi:hypothetical protein
VLLPDVFLLRCTAVGSNTTPRDRNSAVQVGRNASDMRGLTGVRREPFSCIAYWMCGLSPSGNGQPFACFMLITFIFGMNFGAFFRLLSACGPTLFLAQPLSGLCFMLFVLFCGFLQCTWRLRATEYDGISCCSCSEGQYPEGLAMDVLH